ncbi:MAG: heme exporter protein CcmB [Pseudomonadota bacterium]
MAAEFARTLRELLAAPADVLNPIVFLLIGVTLFAIGFAGEPRILAAFAPVVIWVLVLLAGLLSLDSLFQRDLEDGTLEQFVLLAEPGFLGVLGKLVAHWLVVGGALCLVAPLAALSLSLPPQALGVLFVTLLLGTPTLTLIGSIGAALTVGLGRSGMLLALLVLPFYVPVLIFAASAVTAAATGLPHSAGLYWLAATALLALTVTPFAVQAALRIGAEP